MINDEATAALARGDILLTEARRAARQWGLDDPRPVIAATQAVLATLKAAAPADETTAIPLEQAIAEACAESPGFARAYADAEQRRDEPAPVPPPVDALPARWTRPSATELRNLRLAIADPGAFLPRLKLHDDEYESIPAWSARAVQSLVDPAMDTAHRAGVREGRRQATEELTDTVRILEVLDTAEGRLHLRKLIRTGEIVLPHG